MKHCFHVYKETVNNYVWLFVITPNYGAYNITLASLGKLEPTLQQKVGKLVSMLKAICMNNMTA